MAAGWRPLFNGRDLSGWRVAGASGPPAFDVVDGAICTRPGSGLLWYEAEKIGDATLRVVYRMSNDRGNSGVFIRIPAPPADEPDAANYGVEVQIDDRDDDWHATGALYSMTRVRARASKPAGEWNTLDIELRGLRTVVKLNGVLVTDFDGVSPTPPRTRPWEPERRRRPASGYIGLQHHDDRATVCFREVSLRRFGP
jgi:hypothetical protein